MERVASNGDLDIERLIVKSNFRYERKFTAGHLSTHQVLQAVKLHPVFFREIFYKRQVNNIYFDTPDLAFLKHNQIGIADRKKVRIRWYGTDISKVINPILEIKIKNGLVGDKWSYPLDAFRLEDISNLSFLKKIIKGDKIPHLIKELFLSLKPTLINSYQRQYFQSSNKEYRVTIDSDLTYRKITSLHSILTPYSFKELHTIVELKYGLDADNDVDSISSKFPFRLDKSSKYVNGMEFA
jgi:SPX domain protein involved in polyphosphate accumulation